MAEELADKNGRGVKTMFATHYHELTDLAATKQRIQNYSIAVREHKGSIIFLHKLVKGKASRSYGIQVAALAGVPKQVVQRAQEILTNIEQGEFTPTGEPSIGKLLEGVNPDELTPKQAQGLLYELVEEAMRRG